MNQDQAICTIISKNYISSARTLAQSFLTYHPDCKCYVLIVDDYQGFIDPHQECFEIINLSDLKIPQLTDFCFKYNVTELCTAVKALLLEYLIEKKLLNKLLYIDPDILITNPLSNLFDRLKEFDIVLTPHLDTDYPDDNLMPDDSWIMRSGMFNLGFIGVNSSDNAKLFLNWWKEKLYDKCIEDIPHGYFVDQRFIDFVPIFFENFFIEKDVGYNAAYWNLHSRQFSLADGSWRCNDKPLYFFHFSNFDPRKENVIAGHLSRYFLSERPDLQPLFRDYSSKLMENGFKESRNWPYTFGYFETGEIIPSDLRVVYRNNVKRQPNRYDNPFKSKALKRLAAIINFRNINLLTFDLTVMTYKYGGIIKRRLTAKTTRSPPKKG